MRSGIGVGRDVNGHVKAYRSPSRPPHASAFGNECVEWHITRTSRIPHPRLDLARSPSISFDILRSPSISFDLVRSHSISLWQAGCAVLCRSDGWSSRLVTSAWWVSSGAVTKDDAFGGRLPQGGAAAQIEPAGSGSAAARSPRVFGSHRYSVRSACWRLPRGTHGPSARPTPTRSRTCRSRSTSSSSRSQPRRG